MGIIFDILMKHKSIEPRVRKDTESLEALRLFEGDKPPENAGGAIFCCAMVLLTWAMRRNVRTSFDSRSFFFFFKISFYKLTSPLLKTSLYNYYVFIKLKTIEI